ncbi:hypothetical protein AGMMS50222_10700 [Endomicrobiia bacterium]|nr:hypothetical protein AGMMS50222_10700 [Endomicrobiia bacterium]
MSLSGAVAVEELDELDDDDDELDELLDEEKEDDGAGVSGEPSLLLVGSGADSDETIDVLSVDEDDDDELDELLAEEEEDDEAEDWAEGCCSPLLLLWSWTTPFSLLSLYFLPVTSNPCSCFRLLRLRINIYRPLFITSLEHTVMLVSESFRGQGSVGLLLSLFQLQPPPFAIKIGLPGSKFGDKSNL